MASNELSDVLAREREQIEFLRESRGDHRTSDAKPDLVGLALSSGGMRSANFCLGVLQGLAQTGLLRGIDYLSCVGGGGYAGSWFTTRSARYGFPETHKELQDTQTRLPLPPNPLSTRIASYIYPAFAFYAAIVVSNFAYDTNPLWYIAAIGLFALSVYLFLRASLSTSRILTRRYARRNLGGDVPLADLGKAGPYPIFLASGVKRPSGSSANHLLRVPYIFTPLFRGQEGQYEPAPSITTAEVLALSGSLPDTGTTGRIPLEQTLSFGSFLFRLPGIQAGSLVDSLGVYELIRRQCRFVIACDATPDPQVTFEGMGNTIRRCRQDLGVEIEFSVASMSPRIDQRAQKHYNMGIIRYPDGTTGVLLCLKPTLTGDEPADLLQYGSTHPQFPFSDVRAGKLDDDESESYRQLGRHTIKSLADEVKTSPIWTAMPINEILRDIRRQLRPELDKTELQQSMVGGRREITVPDDLVEAIASGECILCGGAGLAAQAGLPTWPALLQGLLESARKRGLIGAPLAEELSASMEHGDLEEAGDELVHRIPAEEVARHLKTALPDATQPSTAHRLLADMPFRGVLNTSLDRLLAGAFGLPPLLPADSAKIVAALPTKDKFVVNVSGLPASPDSIVLNARQFRKQLTDNSQYQLFLNTLFLDYHAFFVGSDIDGVRGFLDALGLSKPPARRQYALIANEGQIDAVKVRYLDRTYNVQVLEYEPGFNYAGFAEYLEELSRKVKRKARSVRTGAGNLTLQSITLENIGPFESISLDFTAGWNLLLGDNGKGKTVILRAIAAGLCGEYADPAMVARLLRSGTKHGVIRLRINNRDYTTELTENTNGRVQVTPLGLSPIQTNRWLVIGFPALRSVPWENPAGPKETEIKEANAEDLLPLLRGAPDNRVSSLKQWLVNLDYEGKKSVIDQFFQALRMLIPGVRIGDYEINRDTKEIRIKSDGGSVPLSAVSQGTGSVMCWVGTLLQRMREAEVSGEAHPLVLIDEIDAHMHPKWQQDFVEAFRGEFPSVQVIATTHSPLMVGSLSQDEIWLVRRSPVRSEIYGIAHIKEQTDNKIQVVVKGPKPDAEASDTASAQAERTYIVSAGTKLRIRDGAIVEENEALTEEEVTIGVERLNIPPEGWRVDQILTLPYFGLDRTRDKKTADLIEDYTRVLADPDQQELEKLAAELRLRAPAPHETKEAREAFGIIKDFAGERLQKLSPDEREKMLTEIKAQVTESITGLRRPM